MGMLSGYRGGEGNRGSPSTSSTQDGVSGVSLSTHHHNKKKWSNLMPLIVAVVVVGEIALLGRLDMAKNAAMVRTWTKSFYYSSSDKDVSFDVLGGVDDNSDSGNVLGGVEENRDSGNVVGGVDEKRDSENVLRGVEDESNSGDVEGDCEDWLERNDAVTYSRDFQKDPIFVAGAHQDWNTCAVGCKFGLDSEKKLDAAFGPSQGSGMAGVRRSMESAQYYAENNIAHARGRGYTVIMTTSLSSDVPVGYFSWTEYDIMAPVQPKTESALAAAFISNCGARNFRLQALELLEKSNLTIDSFGGCHRNHDGDVDKVKTLKWYKFSLAFENSNEEDYVTEKFFQSLVAGSVPVVVGAPNIQEFAPSPNSILHIKELKDVGSVAQTMKLFAENPDAYSKTLSWKYEGPSDSFKALVDMAAVHSSCRLCIHLATEIRKNEEKGSRFKERPCKCTKGKETVYHLYVRERGRFKMESIFLRSSNMTFTALEFAVLAKFSSLNHVPIWKNDRPESIRGGDELKVYRIYPVGMTQRQALYTFRFNKDADLKTHIKSNPCAKFEVIFV